MTNPYIEGFLKIEGARAKRTNIFEEAKKLTAAQKEHFEDFEMLRNEEAGQDRIPQTMFTQNPRAVIRNITAAMPPRRIDTSQSVIPSSADTRPTQRPASLSTTPAIGRQRSVFNPDGIVQGAGQLARPGAGVGRVDSSGHTAGAAMLRGGADNINPSDGPRPIATISSTVPDSLAPRTSVRPVARPTPPTPETQTPTNEVPGTELPAHLGGETGYELPVDGPGGSNGSATAEPAPRNVTRSDRDAAPTPTRVRAQDINPGMRTGRADANEIRSIQSALGITSDGIAGPQTRQAIMNFQRERGLQVDGIIGDQTRTALSQMMAANERDRARPTQMADSFSPAELDHITSILEAMPVAPTDSGDSPNPTPRKKAEGSRSKGSLAD